MKRLILLSFVILACASESQAPQSKAVPLLSIVAGNDQSATVGKILPTQIAARLTDKTSGLPMPGRVVNWHTPDGGTVFAAVSETGTDGVTRQSWTLGTGAGTQALVARWLDPETGEPVTLDTARAVAMADVAARFEVYNAHPAGGNVWAVNDLVLVEYRFSDFYRNLTTICADGGSIDRVTWTSSAPSIIQSLGTFRVVDGKHYAEFRALATSADAVVLTGDPSDVCMDAPASAVVAFVR